MDNNPSNDILSSYRKAVAKKEEQEKKALEITEELKYCANKIFSTEDGQKLARQMIKACHLLDIIPPTSPERLQYISAQRDFVNLFITSLVKRDVLLNIIKDL